MSERIPNHLHTRSPTYPPAGAHQPPGPLPQIPTPSPTHSYVSPSLYSQPPQLPSPSIRPSITHHNPHPPAQPTHPTYPPMAAPIHGLWLAQGATCVQSFASMGLPRQLGRAQAPPLQCKGLAVAVQRPVRCSAKDRPSHCKVGQKVYIHYKKQ